MFFIAEIGSNWFGKIDLARKIIRNCKGANAIKFQMWRARDLGLDKRFELDFDTARDIKYNCDTLGFLFLCSVFYPEAVDFLEKLRVPMYKIASRTAAMKDPYSLETLKAVAETGKPVIISMGMGGNRSELGNIFRDNQIYWLFCKSEYPTEMKNEDWRKIYSIDCFGVEHKCSGISDHTLGITIPLRYSKINPNGIIEKHVKLIDNASPDSHYSITTQELQDFMILSKSFPLKFG